MPDVTTRDVQAPEVATPEVATPDATAQGHEIGRPRALDRLAPELCVRLGIAWGLAYLLVGALEPVTPHPMPAIGIVLTVVFHLALLATAVGLVARRRWALTASLVTGVRARAEGLAALVASTVACPTTGHHGFGLWWIGQLAVSFGIVVATAVAVRRA